MRRAREFLRLAGARRPVTPPPRRFRRAGVVVELVTLEHGELARKAFLDFGKARHKAGLNFCDCFSYALAKSPGEALLFKGADFVLTDVRPA